MRASAEIVIVVWPTTEPIDTEKALPGQLWPPPVTRTSTTSAPAGHGKEMRVASLVTACCVGVVPQPLRFAQST